MCLFARSSEVVTPVRTATIKKSADSFYNVKKSPSRNCIRASKKRTPPPPKIKINNHIFTFVFTPQGISD